MKNLFICSTINKGKVKRTFLVNANNITEAEGKVYIANLKQIQVHDEPIIKSGDTLLTSPIEFENGLMEVI